MSNKNKALTALKRKKFKTGGSTGTSSKRTGPSNVVDLDNPNKDYFHANSLQAPKADIKKAPDIAYDQAYMTEGDEISTLKTGDEREGLGVTVPTVDITSDLLTKDTFKIDSAAGTAKEGEYGVPQGYSLTPGNAGAASYYPNVMPDTGKVFAYNKETGQRIQIDEPGASTYTAGEVKESDFVTASGAEER